MMYIIPLLIVGYAAVLAILGLLFLIRRVV